MSNASKKHNYRLTARAFGYLKESVMLVKKIITDIL